MNINSIGGQPVRGCKGFGLEVDLPVVRRRKHTIRAAMETVLTSEQANEMERLGQSPNIDTQ